MIRPPFPSDVFGRYSHHRPSSTVSFLNRRLPAFRWCSSILYVGNDIDFLRALTEFHPDAVVHCLSHNRCRSENRIQSYSHHQWASLESFALEFDRSFNVVIVADGTNPVPLLRTLRDYSLMVVECQSGLPDVFQYESPIHFLPKESY